MAYRAKTFVELLLMHTKNPDRVKVLIKTDKRVTAFERQIIKGFLLMRDNKNAQGLKLFKESDKQAEPLVESLRLYLIAAFQNNLGLHQEALANFELAYNTLPKNEIYHLEFVLLANITNVYINLYLPKEAQKYLLRMKEIPKLSQDNLHLIDLHRFSISILEGDLSVAQNNYDKLTKIESEMKLHFSAFLNQSFFDFAVVFGNYNLAYKKLEKLKTFRKHFQTQDYNYSKILLDHLHKDKPIYFLEGDFREHKTYLHQLRLLRAMEKSEKEEAKKNWTVLKSLNPYVYGDFSNYRGPKNLFSLCMEKNISHVMDDVVLERKDDKMDIFDAIVYLLKKKKQVTRDELFYFLYGEHLETKDEMLRLSKYISKIKKTTNMEISLKNGKYCL